MDDEDFDLGWGVWCRKRAFALAGNMDLYTSSLLGVGQALDSMSPSHRLLGSPRATHSTSSAKSPLICPIITFGPCRALEALIYLTLSVSIFRVLATRTGLALYSEVDES